jgi:hypothetical protein
MIANLTARSLLKNGINTGHCCIHTMKAPETVPP